MTDAGFVVRQEKDAVATRPIVRIGIAGALIGAGGALVAGLILRSGPRPGGGPSSLAKGGSGVAPRDIGMVTQTLIDEERYARDLREEQRRALDSYAWVDRPRGIVRIPIDRAIELVVARASEPTDAGAGPDAAAGVVR